MRIAKGIGAALLLTACAVPSAASAAPVKGAYYAGTAPGISQPSYVRISSDGRRVTGYFFAYRMACLDGRSRPFARNHINEPRWNLKRDGAFDYRARNIRVEVQRRGDVSRGVASDRFTGAFAGNQVTLTVRARLNGELSCSQNVPITLRRVGSPLLGRADGLMTTAPFSAVRRPGLLVTGLRSVAPARIVADGLKLRWRVRRCARGGRDYRDSSVLFPLVVSPGGVTTAPIGGRYRIGNGFRAITRGRITLRFTKRAGRYRAKGALRVRSRIYRGASPVDTCSFRRSFASVARR